MTLAEFMDEVNDNLRGTDDDTPALGAAEWEYWARVANVKKDELYDDTSKNWSAAYEDRNIGTIAAAAAPTFNLASDFINPADEAYVIDLDGSYHYYDVIKPVEKNRQIRQVYIAGLSPRILHFTDAVEAGETVIGGTLYLPGYWRPANIDSTDEADVIPVDDPHWLAMATAADIALNDITYEDKFDDLNGKAGVLYRMMARKNRKGTYKNPRVTPTRVQRITGFR